VKSGTPGTTWTPSEGSHEYVERFGGSGAFLRLAVAEYLYNVPAKLRAGRTGKGTAACGDGIVAAGACASPKKESLPQETVHPVYFQLVSARLEALLEEGSSPLFALVRPEALRDLLDRNDPQPWYGQLMTALQTIVYFLQLNHWMRTYHVRPTRHQFYFFVFRRQFKL